MKIKDLERYIKESAADNTNRIVRAALITIKMHGINSIKTSQVLRDFEARGITVSTSELLNMLQKEPMIADANLDTITFAKDLPNVQPYSDKNKEENDADTISSMAKKALKKRGL